jgi:hypothetical protein
VPRLALVTAAGAPMSASDLTIAADVSDEQLAAIFTEWRPPERLDALDRIANTLGVAAVAPIVSGLRGELGNAVAELDAGRSETAHRIAGLAGTLGFHSVSTVWNALSHGDTALASIARREARVAMAAIDRWLIAAERG